MGGRWRGGGGALHGAAGQDRQGRRDRRGPAVAGRDIRPRHRRLARRPDGMSASSAMAQAAGGGQTARLGAAGVPGCAAGTCDCS